MAFHFLRPAICLTPCRMPPACRFSMMIIFARFRRHFRFRRFLSFSSSAAYFDVFMSDNLIFAFNAITPSRFPYSPSISAQRAARARRSDPSFRHILFADIASGEKKKKPFFSHSPDYCQLMPPDAVRRLSPFFADFIIAADTLFSDHFDDAFRFRRFNKRHAALRATPRRRHADCRRFRQLSDYRHYRLRRPFSIFL
jgi:hypothetical protein